MAKVVNLNRYRKRRAREEKEKRAETNRRWHGRTNAERARDEAAKKSLEKKLDGAFLVRERVPLETWEEEPAFALARLEEATQDVVTLGEFSRTLTEARERGGEPTTYSARSDKQDENEPE